MPNLFCKICGYKHSEPHWGDDGKSPSYLICPCCGVEAGNEDYSEKSIKQYRYNWMKGGNRWFNPKLKPDNWDLSIQLENVS